MEKTTPLKKPILFITRTYPPVIGGMENLSFDLTTTLKNLTESFIIKNPYGKKALPFFIPYATFKACYLIFTKKIEIVHLSDAVLAPLGFFLKIIFPKLKVVANVHGLDLTYAYKLRLYHFTNILPLRKLDLLIPVSLDTKEECLKLKISEEKISYIPNGTHCDKYYSLKIQNGPKEEYLKKISPEINSKIDFSKDFLILFLGRLTKRKGMVWFVKEVLPKLPPEAKLIVAGGGAELNHLRETIAKKQLGSRAFSLGPIDEKAKKILLNISDILVMPNIVVAGDKEGFGITAIEAGASALLPVVSDLEGLKNAVLNKKNGLRLKSKDAKKYISVIKFLMENPKYLKNLSQESREFVKNNFDWKIIGEKYLKEFQKLENF